MKTIVPLESYSRTIAFTGMESEKIKEILEKKNLLDLAQKVFIVFLLESLCETKYLAVIQADRATLYEDLGVADLEENERWRNSFSTQCLKSKLGMEICVIHRAEIASWDIDEINQVVSEKVFNFWRYLHDRAACEMQAFDK